MLAWEMERGKKKYKRMTTTRWEFCLFYDFLLLTSLHCQDSQTTQSVLLVFLFMNWNPVHEIFQLKNLKMPYSPLGPRNDVDDVEAENTPKNAKRMKWQLLRSKSAHKIPFLHLFLVIPLKNPLHNFFACCQIRLILIFSLRLIL